MLVEIYADEGISGTSLQHRDAFKKMIEGLLIIFNFNRDNDNIFGVRNLIFQIKFALN